MRYLNLLALFTRPSIFAAAMSVAVVFAFVSSASAGENKFDALGGVTAEALTPAAMDAIQGTGSIRVCILCNAPNFFDIVPIKQTGSKWNIVIDIAVRGSGAISKN